MIIEAFKQLGLEEEPLKIYLTLLETGPSSAGRLAKKVSFPRSSLYGFLSELADKGLVIQTQKEGVKVWQANNPNVISDKLDEQINFLSDTKKDFNKALPELLEKQVRDFINPKFQYFEGAEGVKQILKDMLLYRDIKTEAFWPISEMINVFGDEFFAQFNKERLGQNISIRTIWAEGKKVDIKKHSYLGVGKEFLREIRIAPKKVNMTMGYWAYRDKIAFISSKREGFGFIVQSMELRELLKTQFDTIWELSKPMKKD